MKFNRWTLVACLAALVAALALAVTARWNKREAERVAFQRQGLQQTHSELERTRAELEHSVTQAQEKTQELNDAVAKSKQYQEEQRAQATRVVGLANAMIAAAAFKPAVAEFYMSEGKWPTANEDIGLPKPTSFEAKGLHSVSVLPGGKIQLEVDDLGKKSLVFLNGTANEAGHVVWTCTTPSITDIAKLASACTFKSN